VRPPAHDTLRIIDASLNRIGEGLRVLEEYARFSLNDSVLTQQLKDLRHGLVRVNPSLRTWLIRCRDAGGDIGADMEVPGEPKERDISGLIAANARRVEESLRVMEELARDPTLTLDSNAYKRARFSLYTIEKDLLARMLHRDKLGRLAGLYVVIDMSFLKGRGPKEVAGQAIRGGTTVIQLRAKESSVKDFLEVANEVREVCAREHVLFIVNDSLEVALACDADGLHVGQDDLPVAVARRLLPVDKLLGCSVFTLEEARAAQAARADYVSASPVFLTTTKDTAGATGLELIGEIKKATNIPVVAIGGINKNNIKSVIEAGADSAAVISAVMEAADIAKAARQLTEIIKGVKGG
jgi:thiamine-phosphate pyrophosphorylase